MRSYESKVAKECRKRAEAKYGKAWRLIGAEAQDNAVAREVVSVLIGLDSETSIVYIQKVAGMAMYPEANQL